MNISCFFVNNIHIIVNLTQYTYVNYLPLLTIMVASYLVINPLYHTVLCSLD